MANPQSLLHLKRHPIDRQQRRNPRIHPQIPRLLRTIKVPTTPRPRRINHATANRIQMRTPPINKRQDRPVIEQHAPMTGTTRPAARNTWKLYQSRRNNSAAIVG
ncbi:MAG: hypothetical protein CMJ25_28590 [Phycisphaerae bacterium]|nr:hypothetical protein [Phycisphaerae bacterium]